MDHPIVPTRRAHCGRFAVQMRLFRLSPNVIDSPLFAPELLPPVAPFPIASFSLKFQRARPISPPETPFSMEVDLDSFLSFQPSISSETVPHLHTPANTPAVPTPAPISPIWLNPTWFSPSSIVTHASAVNPSFAASIPALLNPPNIIL